MQKIDALSMEEVLQQKEVSWPDIETPESTRFTEFKEPKSFSRDLLENFGYSAENAETLENEVLALLNHPYAIQRKASLEVDGLIRFEVASKTAKNGTVEVKVFKDHSSCICGRYRSDGICKHSLAVASLQSQLPKHLDFIRKRFKRDGNRTSLAEYNVRKDTAGKKGARNKVSYRAERAKGRSASSTEGKGNDNQNQPFTEIHHNDNQFNLAFLTEEAATCKSCGINFCHRVRVIPFDLVLMHRERWYYPMNGNWSEKRPSKQETTRFYHTTKKCLLPRFPYFTGCYVEISPSVLSLLTDSHKNYLSAELGLKFE